jgi:prolyl 4-hydroxylase
MSILDQAQLLAAAGKREEAVRLVVQAAGAGDGEALFAVANWRLFGIHGPRDLAATHRMLDQAVAAGDAEAALLKSSLLANGAGCVADEAGALALLRSIGGNSPQAATQIELLQAMRADEPGPEAGRLLCGDPHVRAVPGLLSAAECRYLMERSERHLQPSFINHPVTGRRTPHPTRTSMGMSFGPSLEDAVVRRINRRLATVSGTQLACGEPLHMLRYTAGQEYKPHVDTIGGESNQRAWTVLVYLNAGYTGGATLFDLLGVEYVGSPGDVLVFGSLDAQGRPDPRTRHAGLPILAGVKWLATRWIRQRPVQLLSE